MESDARARPKPFTFRPPKSNRVVIALVKMAIRRAIRRKLKVTEIDVSEDDLEKLKEVSGNTEPLRRIRAAYHHVFVEAAR